MPTFAHPPFDHLPLADAPDATFVRAHAFEVGEDEGALPDVITDAGVAQLAMRAHAIKASMAILITTARHAIDTGNMRPAFVTEGDGTRRALPTIRVDSSEFVVSKLKDRGTHQPCGVVTNAQHFMQILRPYVERELDVRAARVAPSPAGSAR